MKDVLWPPILDPAAVVVFGVVTAFVVNDAPVVLYWEAIVAGGLYMVRRGFF
jgi:hypothetical protein